MPGCCTQPGAMRTAHTKRRGPPGAAVRPGSMSRWLRGRKVPQNDHCSRQQSSVRHSYAFPIPMHHGRGAFPQTIQAPIIEVARVLQRFRQTPADLAKIKTFKEIHLKRCPLFFTQLFKSRVQLFASQEISDLLLVVGLYL